MQMQMIYAHKDQESKLNLKAKKNKSTQFH